VRAEITGSPTNVLFTFWTVADSRDRVHGDGSCAGSSPSQNSPEIYISGL
jgi:hypothetical protein